MSDNNELKVLSLNAPQLITNGDFSNGLDNFVFGSAWKCSKMLLNKKKNELRNLNDYCLTDEFKKLKRKERKEIAWQRKILIQDIEWLEENRKGRFNLEKLTLDAWVEKVIALEKRVIVLEKAREKDKQDFKLLKEKLK